MDTLELLNCPLPQLAFSEPFILNAIKMGYQTIGEIIEEKPEVLQAHPHFSYTWIGELSEFMLQYRLLHLLQPATGKIPV